MVWVSRGLWMLPSTPHMDCCLHPICYLQCSVFRGEIKAIKQAFWWELLWSNVTVDDIPETGSPILDFKNQIPLSSTVARTLPWNSRLSKTKYQTFGRVSRYNSGTSISAKATLLIAVAALRIWFAHSSLQCSCFLESSDRPLGGTRGTGSHHLSSCRWIAIWRETDPSASGATIPWSTYQNSVLVKASSISYNTYKGVEHHRDWTN